MRGASSPGPRGHHTRQTCIPRAGASVGRPLQPPRSVLPPVAHRPPPHTAGHSQVTLWTLRSIIRVKIMRKSIFRGLLDSYLQHAVFVPFGLYRQCFFLQRKDVSLYVCIFFLFFYTEDSIPYTLFQTLLFH